MNNAENLFSQYINLEKGIIRICGGKFLVNKYVMPSLVGFIKDYPNIDIRISRATTQESLKKLSNGEIDIAMLNLSDIPTEYTNIDFISLKSTPRYCFIATNDYIKENKISKDSNFENCKIKEFQIGEDNKSIATLKKNMCNKATLELVRRIKENFMK